MASTISMTADCHCIKCGSTKVPQQEKDFYRTQSSMYTTNGYLPICKKHLQEMFDSYADKYKDKRRAMQRICMAFDLYYNDHLFDSSYSYDPSNMIGVYLRKLNMAQYRGRTFDDTIAEGRVLFVRGGDEALEAIEAEKNKRKQVKKKQEEAKKAEEEGKISKRSIEQWGAGLTSSDYSVLDSHYKYLKSANPNCDSNQEIFINDLCYTKMQQLKAVREGRVDDYNKLTESYRKSFSQAGLKTVQETAQTAEDCWSAWTNMISQYTPEEYYLDKQLYQDFDALGEYYERMAVRPLRNLELGTNDRDYQYYVHDEDSDGDDDGNSD